MDNSPNLASAQAYIIYRQKHKTALQCVEKGESYAKAPDTGLQHMRDRETLDRVYTSYTDGKIHKKV